VRLLRRRGCAVPAVREDGLRRSGDSRVWSDVMSGSAES